MELVANRWVYIRQTKMHFLLQELFVAILASNLLAWHGDAFLLCAAMIVLCLDFEEGVVAVHVRPDAHLLPWSTTIVMLQVEAICVRVPIGCHVARNLCAAMELRVVLPLSQFQQAGKVFLVRHELGVRAIHQANLLHLCKRDGL